LNKINSAIAQQFDLLDMVNFARNPVYCATPMCDETHPCRVA
jgi:hypothetical protein